MAIVPIKYRIPAIQLTQSMIERPPIYKYIELNDFYANVQGKAMTLPAIKLMAQMKYLLRSIQLVLYLFTVY